MTRQSAKVKAFRSYKSPKTGIQCITGSGLETSSVFKGERRGGRRRATASGSTFLVAVNFFMLLRKTANSKKTGKRKGILKKNMCPGRQNPKYATTWSGIRSCPPPPLTFLKKLLATSMSICRAKPDENKTSSNYSI